MPPSASSLEFARSAVSWAVSSVMKFESFSPERVSSRQHTSIRVTSALQRVGVRAGHGVARATLSASALVDRGMVRYADLVNRSPALSRLGDSLNFRNLRGAAGATRLQAKLGSAAVADLALRLVGAPEELTDVTSLAVDATPVGMIFSGFVSFVASAYAVVSDESVAPTREVADRQLRGDHSTIVQGYSMVGHLAFGDVASRREAASDLSSDAAENGELGLLPMVANFWVDVLFPTPRRADAYGN